MCGFKIICENGLYHFDIIPSNNNNQPMGHSVEYTSRAECEQAVHAFKKLIKENQIISTASPFVRIDKIDNLFVYKYFDKENNLLFSSHSLWHKSYIDDLISSIYTNYIDAPVLQD